jgi:pimeloyl-ACP methyl ester carboxylesterase
MMTERLISTGAAKSLNVATGPVSGPPLVLLHGVTRRWQDYVSLLPALTSRWHVHALDFRGHGKSERTPGAYRVADYVADAVALLRDLDEPAVVYGHSLGAMVAAAGAAAEPGRVRAVVMEDPPFDTMGARIDRTPYVAQFRGTRDAVLASGGSVDGLAARLADVRLPAPGGAAGATIRMGDVRDAVALRFLARCLVDVDPELLTPIIEGRWLDGYARQDVLRGIACPALLMQADPAAGGMLSDADAAEAAGLMPRGLLVRVPNAGHQIHWAQPDAVLRLTNGFLESL